MKRFKNNKGFSLVELIVVIAIMGVMMAVGGYALSAISLANAKECTEEIEAALVRTRTQSYSCDSSETVAEVSLYRGTDGIYISKSYEGSPEKISSSKVSVSYLIDGQSDYKELETEKLTFSFNRSSGAFRPVKVDGQTKNACTSIKVTSGGRTYTIKCYEKTGKITVE